MSAFYWDHNVVLFLESFNVTTPKGLVLAFIVILIMSTIHENMRCIRYHQTRWIKRPSQPKMMSLYQLVSTIMFLFDMILVYLVMLAVMTFNAWMLVAVVAGSVLGRISCIIAHACSNGSVSSGPLSQETESSPAHPDKELNDNIVKAPDSASSLSLENDQLLFHKATHHLPETDV